MARTIASTPECEYQGSLEKGIHIFRGIPYAQPPLGPLRWMPPQPIQKSPGEIKTLNFGPVAPQNPTGVPQIPEFIVNEPQSEDCLLLNVWTPGLDPTRRPVMVWIHGGAYTMGSGSQAVFEASKLARNSKGVIVTLNYRLGLLGFLNLSSLTGGKIPATGNEGLMDQVMALRWVRKNISCFGGDPENVTVFGESAGAMSTGCLLAMPSARGLFHKAILQSGAASNVLPLPSAVEIAKKFLKIVGLRADDIQSLQRLKTGQILHAQQILLKSQGMLTTTLPVIDGDVIPGAPLECIKNGSADGIPVLIGTNRDEYRLFNMISTTTRSLDEQGLIRRCQRLVLEADVSSLVDVYRKSRRSRRLPAGPADLWAAIQTDLLFRMPVIHLLEALRTQRQAAFTYLFSWESPAFNGILGACHALEVGFVFGNYDPGFGGSGTEADKLSRVMQDSWVSMSRTGNPNHPGFSDWEPYGPNRQTLIIDSHSHMEAAPFDEVRRFWAEIEAGHK